ncbi:adenylate/guanylate cyclase domain-containing protein [bacterium]|nr:adenylate/guanylate cyclase domain-containing protein [bacterium]
MTLELDMRARKPVSLLVAFTDLTHFQVECARTGDEKLAAIMDDYYERVSARVERAGGRVVKFMGDAALIVFSREDADAGTVALIELKEEIDAHMEKLRWQSRLIVKAHVGEVVAGPYGAKGEKRFDLLGREVNVAATLLSRSFAISVDAFRKLSPETRKRFKKHTPPVTYIPLDARRP